MKPLPGQRIGGLNCIALTKKQLLLPLPGNIKYNTLVKY